jgi:hypothetical protein
VQKHAERCWSIQKKLTHLLTKQTNTPNNWWNFTTTGSTRSTIAGPE